MMTDNWIVDTGAGVIKHKITGITLIIEKGEPVNIYAIPQTITNSELPRLIDEALRAYEANIN